MKFTLKGVSTMVVKMQNIVKKLPDKVGSALYIEGQLAMTASKKRVPVDKGTLRSSGVVMRPERSGKRVWVTLAYGGAASAYAIAVHEHLSVYSPPSWVKAEATGAGVHFHPEGTGPKYLESVINEIQPYLEQRIGARLAFASDDTSGQFADPEASD